MKRVVVTVAIAGAVGIGMAGVVVANTGSISDPKGDVADHPSGNEADYDIVKAAYGHAKHGKTKASSWPTAPRTRGSRPTSLGRGG